MKNNRTSYPWITGLPIALILPFVLLFSACLSVKSPAPDITYYQLDYQISVASSLKPLPIVFQVNRFSVAPFYDSTKMIFQKTDYSQQAYVYHRWRSNPGEMITYFITRDLVSSALFKGAFKSKKEFDDPYIIEGSINQFYEKIGITKSKAVIDIDFTVIGHSDKSIGNKDRENIDNTTIVLQKRYHEEKSCEARNPVDFVKAASMAMSNISDRFIQDIYSRLNRDPATPNQTDKQTE